MPDEQVTNLTHVLALIKELEKRVWQRFKDHSKAIKAALKSLNSRLAIMNEFRTSLEKYTLLLATKEELAAQIKSLRDEMRVTTNALNGRIDSAALGSTQRSEANGKRLDTIDAQLNRISGAGEASKSKNDTTKYAIGLAVTLILLALALAAAIGPRLK